MTRRYTNLFRVTLLTIITALLGWGLGKSVFEDQGSIKTISNNAVASEGNEAKLKPFDPSDQGLKMGAIIQPTTLVDLKTGKPVHLFASASNHSDDKNKFIVLTFFSVRCPGCAEDIGFWKELMQACRKREIKFYLATFDSDTQAIKHFADLIGFTDMPILYDGQRVQAAGVFDIDIIPTTYVFHSNGEVIAKGLGLRWFDNGKHLSGNEKLQKVLEWIGG